MGRNKLSLSERLANARAVLGVEEPAKAVKKDKAVKVRKAKAKRARKTTNRKAVTNGSVAGHKCLIQANRRQFIADHDWAQELTSTSDLARAVIAGAPLTGVWALGPKTVARLTGQDDAVAITAESQGHAPVKAKKGKKGKKARKVEVVREVTEAEQARLDSPRNAYGKLTPKREWAVREALAESGQYDRYQIEAEVAKAYAEGLIELPEKG